MKTDVNPDMKESKARPALRLAGRVALILLAALVVIGATAALVNNGVFGAAGDRGEGRGRPEFGRFEGGERVEPEGRFERGDEPGGGLSLAGLAGTLRDLAAIGMIVLGVALVSRAGGRLGARRKSKAPPDYM